MLNVDTFVMLLKVEMKKNNDKTESFCLKILKI